MLGGRWVAGCLFDSQLHTPLTSFLIRSEGPSFFFCLTIFLIFNLFKDMHMWATTKATKEGAVYYYLLVAFDFATGIGCSVHILHRILSKQRITAILAIYDSKPLDCISIWKVLGGVLTRLSRRPENRPCL